MNFRNVDAQNNRNDAVALFGGDPKRAAEIVDSIIKAAILEAFTRINNGIDQSSDLSN